MKSVVMDDAKLGFGLFLLLTVFLTLLAHAAEIEYVSPDQRHELEELFDRATLKTEALHKGQTWTCEMYGMRSHVQVQHGMQLYTLKDEGQKGWSNRGAQVVTQYKESQNALVGATEKFQDEIKVAEDGRLVSRLTFNADKKTLAYAVCKTL